LTREVDDGSDDLSDSLDSVCDTLPGRSEDMGPNVSEGAGTEVGIVLGGDVRGGNLPKFKGGST
jgi:hypothetical protein